MLSFVVGHKYSRPDVREVAGLVRTAKGGEWDTGIVKHRGEFVIFANVGTVARTGHDYGNRWEEGRLRWYHKRSSHLGWRSVQQLLAPQTTVHVFWRTSNKSSFEYAGLALALEVADTCPVEILWQFGTKDVTRDHTVQSPEEQPFHSTYPEGATRRVLVNAYERDRTARDACIRHHGLGCAVCALRFEERYGAIGAGFIHVHHLHPLSKAGPGYRVDPVDELRPVCANCHAMLHRRRPPLSVEELRDMLR